MIITDKNQRMFRSVLVLSYVLACPFLSIATDTILSGESLSGNQTLASQGGTFEMGFFTPDRGSSENYYIGIWYKGLPSRTVVWVANRDQPVSDPSFSELKLLEDGSMVIVDPSNLRVWSMSATQTTNSTIGVLLDSGNFVVRSRDDSSNVVWQSFDHPADTWLPGAKFGYSKLTTKRQELVSWRSLGDPSSGKFSAFVGLNGKPQYSLSNGSMIYYNSSFWTGKYFTNVLELSVYYMMNIGYVSNENESYFHYYGVDPFNLIRVVPDENGQFQHLVWVKGRRRWILLYYEPAPECEIIAFCGVSRGCNQSNVPICERVAILECERKGDDKFFVLPQTRIPQYYDSFSVESIEYCRSLCLSNFSCAAFAYDNYCYLWTEERIMVQRSSGDAIGRDMYVRVADCYLKRSAENLKKVRWDFVLGGCFVSLFGLAGLVLVIVICRRHRKSSSEIRLDGSLGVFKYKDLKKATRNFSMKIGEGGFGSVYRGILPDSTFIAVKRLNSPCPSEKQFLAEIRSIGLIHHMNLVHLLGFCIEGSKKLLVFDYVPNHSLGYHLFRAGSSILSWKTRYKIAIGIAKGLAYLHEKCRECIIHCDIKPENILLDSGMEPKIADFGLAKLVGRDISRVITTIRGTRGYLAPEWISGEAITPKVDVFSYGKLLFEIISGRRNMDLLKEDMTSYFPMQVANKVHGGEELLTLLDYTLEDAAEVAELSIACRVACWCIQDSEKNRPTMSRVVQLLEGVAEVTLPPMPRYFQRFLGY